MEAPQRYLDLYAKDEFPRTMQAEYAFSAVIDEGVGNVTKALKAKGMWHNTLLVVSSDNGGPSFSDQHAASNFPLRGGKYTYWEGGLRTNAFVTGGVLPQKLHGTNLSIPIHISDWYATFSSLAGVDPSDDHEGIPSIDSVNQWPILSGQANPEDDEAAMEREIFLGSGVLMQGRYKLIATGVGYSGQWSGPLYPKVPATGPLKGSCQAKTPCLFDVEADPEERNDMAKAKPEIVQKMQSRLASLSKGIFEGVPPKVAKNAVCEATAKNGGFLTPSDWHA